MKITAQTRITGVVGNPVRHSLSPIIHNAWIEAGGLDAVYLAFEPPKERFRQFIDGLRGKTVVGLNVTIPFKEEALELADEVGEDARLAGAANTLVFREDGGILAFNTDGDGLGLALREAGAHFKRPVISYTVPPIPTADHAVVLGAGGAAKGAVAMLAAASVGRIDVINRDRRRAEEIASSRPEVIVRGWDDTAAALAGADLLINATSLGMIGQPPLELDLEALPQTAIVMDMVYRPLETRLLREARARGNRTNDGLSMLIEQANLAFFSFFGRAPQDTVDVRGLCEAALRE